MTNIPLMKAVVPMRKLKQVVLMRKMKQKLYKKSGFTLAETLVVVLILLMVSAIVATGIPVARNAYEKVVLASNAEVLLSTTISSLRNELGTAQNVTTTDDSTVITYYNKASETTSKICLNSDLTETDKTSDPDGTIMYQRYANTGLSKGGNITRLVSKAASNKNLYVTYSSVSYSKGIVIFSGLKVCKETDTLASDPLASRVTFSIRVISSDGTETDETESATKPGTKSFLTLTSLNKKTNPSCEEG